MQNKKAEKCVMVRYKVKSSGMGVVKKAIAEFVKAIKKHDKGTLSYDAFQLKDGTSFVHFMSFKDSASEEKHRTAIHTRKFVEVLYLNCEIKPKFYLLNRVE